MDGLTIKRFMKCTIKLILHNLLLINQKSGLYVLMSYVLQCGKTRHLCALLFKTTINKPLFVNIGFSKGYRI